MPSQQGATGQGAQGPQVPPAPGPSPNGPVPVSAQLTCSSSSLDNLTHLTLGLPARTEGAQQPAQGVPLQPLPLPMVQQQPTVHSTLQLPMQQPTFEQLGMMQQPGFNGWDRSQIAAMQQAHLLFRQQQPQMTGPMTQQGAFPPPFNHNVWQPPSANAPPMAGHSSSTAEHCKLLARLRSLLPGSPEPGLHNPYDLARLIVSSASELPTSLRHEFLAAAAATPQLSSAFQPLYLAQGQLPGELAQDQVNKKPATLKEVVAKLKELMAAYKQPRRFFSLTRPRSRSLSPREQAGASASSSSSSGGSPPAPQPPPPRPDGEALALSVIPEYEQYGVAADETVRAVISLKAATEAVKRANVALTCVLDRSGSMSGSRIGLVRETCHFLIDQLEEGDYLGLVSYSGEVRSDLPLMRMSTAAKALAHNIVASVRAEGATALYDGLVAGVRQQMQAETELAGGRVVHSCFLFTDGQATDGPRDAPSILSGLSAVQSPTAQHVTVHTFGFGDGHDVGLLQKVAEAQSGVYYYVRDLNDIAGGFGDALGGLMSVVAKKVRVSIAAAPGVELAAFRSGGRTAASGTTAAPIGQPQSPAAAPAVPTAATFNDVFAEESRELLVTLRLPALPGFTAIAEDANPDDDTAAGQDTGAPLEVTLADVALEYEDVATGTTLRGAATLRVLRSPAPRPDDVAPHELVHVTALRYDTIDAIEAAQRLAAQNGGRDVRPAHLLLDGHLNRITSGRVQSAHTSALAEQTRLARGNIKPRFEFTQDGVAYVAQSVQMLKQQRSTSTTVACTSIAAAMYQNASKDAYRKRASQSVMVSYMSRNGSGAAPY